VQAQVHTYHQTLQQYVADLQRNQANTSLREKIIKLAQTLPSEPAVLEDVHEGKSSPGFSDASYTRRIISAVRTQSSDDYKLDLPAQGMTG
jgi:hypothetical protein